MLRRSLTVDVGELIVEAGGAIDVSGLGYPPTTTYPGHGLGGTASGGSHIGQGGQHGTTRSAETFGSVYRPQEAGGGGYVRGSVAAWCGSTRTGFRSTA